PIQSQRGVEALRFREVTSILREQASRLQLSLLIFSSFFSLCAIHRLNNEILCLSYEQASRL
ncbi:hypothetical protein, partial [Pseudoalteromonas sp. S1691]|uniref:hypothetical protein n=1 Tax=Pseudoalteromonas sp. S1691 TaxID=579513 RepID=UPI001BB24908